MWETAATFDPESGELVHHGGHVTYEQSSYTYLYDPDNGTIRRAKPRRTPPRVCLQDGTESRKVSVFLLDCRAMAHAQVNSKMEFTLRSKLPTKPDHGCTTAPRTTLNMPVPSAIALPLINMRRWPMTQAAMLFIHSAKLNFSFTPYN
jgi:hypothetical protein